jgi:hypothetical protein
MNKVTFICVIFLLIFAACKTKSDMEARVEVIDGIEHVFNTGAPLYPNRKVSFEEELAISPEDEEGNFILFQPMSFIVDRNENIYITDVQENSIKVFDSHGKYKLTIGRRGQGPGEFQYLGSQTFLPDGRLLVMDSMQKRTTLFSAAGEFLESFQWKESLGRLYVATESSLILSKYTFEGKNNPLEGRRLFIREYDFGGNELNSFGEFTVEETRIWAEANRAAALSWPHSPRSIFSGDHVRQHLYHCLNSEYAIEVYDRRGELIRKIQRSYDPVPLSHQEAEEFRARYKDAPSMRKVIEGMPMPNVKPITTRMLIDDKGNLWVETHEEKEEEGQIIKAYDFFNADGFYEAKVWLDKDPTDILKDKMYLMETDEETGIRIVKRFKVVWNE